jgi:hypothetical protein
VQQHESALVRNVQVAREGESRLAFDFVAKDRHGSEIAAQRKLVAGEQRAAGNGKIFHASPAAETGARPSMAAIAGINPRQVETEASITNKLKHGSFPATWFLAMLAALELDGVALGEI